MWFSYCSGQQQIDNNNKCRQIAGDFDCHADAAVRRGAHCPMEHIQHPGFHLKPLDAAIKQVPAPYHPGGRHGRQICWNNTKH